MEQALCLCFHLCEDGISLTFGVDTLLLSLSLGSDDESFLLDFLCHDDVCLLARTLAVGTGILGFLLGSVCFFESLSVCHFFSSHSFSLSLGFPLTTHGIRIGNRNLGFILTLHGFSIRLGSTDTRLTHSLSLTNLTVSLLLGNANLGFIDGFSSSFLTKSFDVATLILDVRHVNVDETQADLLQLNLDVSRDSLKELIAVAVQFLDAHSGNDETQLSEEDVSGQFLNLLRRLSEQTFCGSQHALRLRADTHGEATRHVHADVLLRQGIRQVRIDANRRQGKVSIILDDGPHEGTTAVHTFGTLAVTTIAINHQNLVTGAATIAINNGHEEEDEYDDSNHNKIEGFHKTIYYLMI